LAAEQNERFEQLESWQAVNKGDLSEPEQVEARLSDDGPALRAEVRVGQSGIFGWQSPSMQLDEGQYYRFAFRWRSTCPAFWEAQFSPEPGVDPTDFHTSGMGASSLQWQDHVFFFRAKPGMPNAHVLVWPFGAGIIELAAPSLTRAERSDAWAWFERIMASVPPITPNEDDRRSLFVVETLGKLRQGERADGPVDIAICGDSIAFDVGNLPLDLALEHAYPGSRVAIHTRGGSGAGWKRLSAREFVQEHLVPINPDLLMTLSISNNAGQVTEFLPRIVGPVREACGSEFMLLTNHLPAEDRGDRYEIVAKETRAVARRERCQLVDLNRSLKSYLRVNEMPFEFLLRDACHFNERGRAVVLQLLMQHLGV